MKQTAGGKNKIRIWIVAGIAAVLAAAVAAVLLLWPKSEAGQSAQRASSTLFWNVDGVTYTENSETGLSTREPGEDGVYHIRFAADGQLQEFRVADVQLVNYIDSMQVMGLVFDGDGFVVDAIPAKDLAREVGRDLFVRDFDGTKLVLNSSISMNGMAFNLTVTGDTGIYEVYEGASQPGSTGVPSAMDMVTVFADEEGNPTHVFITEKAKPSDIYWRIGYYWDDVSNTTRVPDENGVYTLQFAHWGQLVELKCKDVEIVKQIDKRASNNAACGLALDEDGYIIEFMLPSMGMRGMELCNNANLTELTETYFSATRLLVGEEQGKTTQGILTPDVKVYLVCNGGTEESFVGEATTLRPDDRITCYTDLDGQVKLIYVTRRMADSPMYFNLAREYISSQKRTERKPDSSGWYTFEMAVGGKIKTVKTKSLDIANQIDSISSRGMGLKLNGSVVEKVYSADCVCGWTTAVNGRYVTGISSNILSAAHPGDFENYANFVINDDCEIYDVSGAYGTTGKKTQVQEGDEIIAFRDTNSNLTHIYVTGRYQAGAKIYYNIARRYNSLTQETTRQPDAEGYYVYEMVSQGKTVTVKTKSKELASYIDRQNAPLVALKVSGEIVKNAYPVTAAVRYSAKTANFHYVDSLTDGVLKTYYISDGERRENPTTYTVDSDCEIYNVSGGYVNYRGEKTKLKKDDRIQALVTNPRGEITQIYIMERKIESSLYWNTKRMYKNGETTRLPDEDGYYVYQLAVKGVIRTLKTKDKALADRLDEATTAVGLLLDGDVIKQVYDTSTIKGIKTLSIGRYDVMEVSGKTVTFTRNRPTSSNYGDTQKVKMTSGCKVYDVSSYAEAFGAAVELQLGDRVAGYTNDDGELVYAYIVNRNTHKAGHISYCDHCGKEVFWEPYADEIVEADVHYYLTSDRTIASRLNIGKQDEERFDVVFDLNGYTLTCGSQAFLVCDQLTLIDTASGGKVIAGSSGSIMVSGGKLQLYSGTLEAGESFAAGSGGLVYLASNGEFTMYGGKIQGGKAAEEGKVATGGNVLVTSTASFTMLGGEISGGSADRGGNIYATGKVLLQGGTVTAGTAERGGNLYLGAGAKAALSGTELLNGVATNRGGNLCDEGATTVLTAGKLSGGQAQGSFGGNLCITGPADMKISGGIIENGRAAGNGGNIAVAGTGALIEMTAGQITGGQAQGSLGGGNLYLAGADEENQAKFVMTGGAVAAGSGTNGGNLRLNANSAAYLGGTVTGGTATEGGSISIGSVSAKLVISGSVTGGQVYVNKNEAVVLTGAPVVDQLVIAEGNRIMLDALQEGTAVTVTATNAFTVENQQASGWVTYFESTDSAKPVTEENGVLLCKAAEPEPEPEPEPEDPVGAAVAAKAAAMAFPTDGSDFVADCPACGATSVTWKAVTKNGRVGYNTTGHFYCSGITASPHTQFIGLDNGGTVCLHLNGETLRNAGRIAALGGGSVINIMGNGKVIGNGTAGGDYSLGVLVAQNSATINLYGGTYTSALADMPVVYLSSTVNPTVNLHEAAVIDSNVGHNVDVVTGTFNMYGGEIKNAVTTGSGGNVRLRSSLATFHLYGGSICAGQSSAVNAGGNVYLTGNSRFEMHGGKIIGGAATAGAGGNVNIYKGTFILHDGQISGGTAETDPNVCVSSTEGTFSQLGGTVE